MLFITNYTKNITPSKPYSRWGDIPFFMTLRYRKSFAEKWETTDSESDIGQILCRIGPTESLEIRLDCQHEDTFVVDGLRQCKNCLDILEVTSYRD